VSVAHEIALRLVALRQAGLGHTGGAARSWRRAWTDDLAVWAAWLQTRPEELAAVLHLLATEIAQTRRERDLPIVDVPAPVLPADPDHELQGPAGDAATLDRLGVMLRTFPDWRIEVTLASGETVTARPARRLA
jgi:hypothetical protein